MLMGAANGFFAAEAVEEAVDLVEEAGESAGKCHFYHFYHPWLGVYTILYHPFMMIWGMVDDCFTHTSGLDSGGFTVSLD